MRPVSGQRRAARPPAGRIGALLAAGVLAACVSDPTPLYPGPPRARSQVALIAEADPRVAAVVAIGGVPVSADAWLVEPGVQALWIRVKAAGRRFRRRYRLTGYCPLEFPVVPGGTYTVAPVITSEESAAAIRIGLGVIVYDHHGDAVAGHTDCTGERPSADEST